MTIFYVFYNDTAEMFEDFYEAEEFAEKVDGILSDAWGEPIC